MGIPRNDFAFEGRSILDDADEAYENLRERREEVAYVPTQAEAAHLRRIDIEIAEDQIALIRGGRW